jgi:hypothetical protein
MVAGSNPARGTKQLFIGPMMLRDFPKTLTSDLVDVLNEFRFDEPHEIVRVAILRFEIISPDAFMWRLLINDGVFYLYAEDYVPSLEYVKHIFVTYIAREGFELVPAREAIPFSFASPISRSATYQKPDDSQDMAQFAVHSGYDFVFLAASKELAAESYFSDKAPHGYDGQ